MNLRPTEAELQEGLAQAQKWLKQDPTDWIAIENIARCLHWSNDPSARERFRQAAELAGPAKKWAQNPAGLIRLGNLYRLAGDEKKAKEIFNLAVRVLEPSVRKPKPNLISAADLVEVYFLLGEDEKAEAVWEQFRSQFRHELRVHAVGQLARERRTGDRAAALEIAKAFAEMIREEKTLVYYTAAGLTLWDWYELAMETAGMNSRQA